MLQYVQIDETALGFFFNVARQYDLVQLRTVISQCSHAYESTGQWKSLASAAERTTTDLDRPVETTDQRSIAYSN